MTAGYIGRYRVLGELGRGAMGVVFRALDENLDREVAVKVLSSSQAHDVEAKKRFLREGRAAGRLQHPNIVSIFELGEHEGAPFMAMELLDGRDLQQAIKQGLRPNPRSTLPIVLQVLAGLAHAHEHGIVHRDIKPANIFLPKGRPAKIMDFGIARLTGSVTAANMTKVGDVMGTPNYMSPEQVRGATLDARSDLFSTGLITYELVTGEKAYQGDSIVSLLFRITQGPPDLHLPTSREWGRLRAVLERALAHDPEDRYPDARAMEADLALALGDLGGASDSTGASDRAVMRTRPREVPSEMPVMTQVPVPTEVVPPPAVDPWTIPAPADAWEPGSDASRRTYRHVPAPSASRPPSSSSTPVLLGLGGALLLLAGGGFLAWSALGRRGAEPALASPAPVPTAPPVTVAVAPPTPLPTSTPAPGATDRPVTPRPTSPPVTAAPVTPRPARPPEATLPRTPEPTRPAAPEPMEALAARLERANAAFERGRYAQALVDARYVLQRAPGNAEARTLVEDTEAAIAVEGALKRARELIKKGDDDGAMTQVRAGLAVSPTDSRLLALFRELSSR